MCPAGKHSYTLVEREMNAANTRVVSIVLFCPKCGETKRTIIQQPNRERPPSFNLREANETYDIRR